MDGNGRWATGRFLPRVAGHGKGVEAVREIVEACAVRGVEYLTLFAFSSENWRRPAEEVSLLMRLFMAALEREVGKMHANGIRLKVVGDLGRFDDKLQQMIDNAERKTAGNTAMTVTVCANYGGRWDVMQAVQKMVAARAAGNPQQAGAAQDAAAAKPDVGARPGVSIAAGVIDGAALLDEIRASTLLTTAEKCAILLDHTMYPSYAAYADERRGCPAAP
jgi:undecaprenyl diphosphate synthase